MLFVYLLALFLIGVHADLRLRSNYDLTRFATDPERRRRGQPPAPQFNSSSNDLDNFLALIRQRALPGDHFQMPFELLDMISDFWMAARPAAFITDVLKRACPIGEADLRAFADFLDRTEYLPLPTFERAFGLSRVARPAPGRSAHHAPFSAFAEMLQQWYVRKRELNDIDRQAWFQQWPADERRRQRHRVMAKDRAIDVLMRELSSATAVRPFVTDRVRRVFEEYGGTDLDTLAGISARMMIDMYARVPQTRFKQPDTHMRKTLKQFCIYLRKIAGDAFAFPFLTAAKHLNESMDVYPGALCGRESRHAFMRSLQTLSTESHRLLVFNYVMMLRCQVSADKDLVQTYLKGLFYHELLWHAPNFAYLSDHNIDDAFLNLLLIEPGDSRYDRPFSWDFFRMHMSRLINLPAGFVHIYVHLLRKLLPLLVSFSPYRPSYQRRAALFAFFDAYTTRSGAPNLRPLDDIFDVVELLVGERFFNSAIYQNPNCMLFASQEALAPVYNRFARDVIYAFFSETRWSYWQDMQGLYQWSLTLATAQSRLEFLYIGQVILNLLYDPHGVDTYTDALYSHHERQSNHVIVDFVSVWRAAVTDWFRSDSDLILPLCECITGTPYIPVDPAPRGGKRRRLQ